MNKVLSVFKLKFTYFIIAVGLLWMYARQFNSERNIVNGYESAYTMEVDTMSVHREKIVERALAQIGTAYADGGTTHNTGFDCSGLVCYAYKDVKPLPRTTSQLSQAGNVITIQDAKAGDLLFFESFFPGYRDVGHVGIVVHSNYGKVAFVHASSEGVQIDSLKNPAYKLRFLYARSML